MSASLLLSAAMLQFLAGYIVILATPGPITLTAGSLACLHGFGRVVPLLTGVCMGIGVLAALLAMGAAHLAQGSAMLLVRLAGAMALGLVAFRIARAAPCSLEPPPAASHGGLFTGGMLIGFLSPATASFFAVSFAGVMLPIQSPSEALSVAAVAALFGTGWYALVAAALSHPFARALAARKHRLICRAAAACLALLAVRTALSVFFA